MSILVSTASVRNMSIFLCIIFIFFPITVNHVLAQFNANVCFEAEKKAEEYISGSTWFLAGCAFNVFGWMLSFTYPISRPPAGDLLGKSPDDVSMYIFCYKKKAKDIRTTQSLYGALVNTAVSMVLYVVLLSSN